jgi:hypothetical protein
MMKFNKETRKLVPVMLVIAVLVYCSGDRLAGGSGSDAGNGRIEGRLVANDGTPASDAIVTLVPADYNPVTMPRSDVMAVTANEAGEFVFSSVQNDRYNILANQPSSGLRALIRNVVLLDKDVTLRPDTLRVPGAIRIYLADTIDPSFRYIFIQGTAISAFVNKQSSVQLDSVPSGTMYSVLSGVTNNPAALRGVADSVAVGSGDTTVVMYSLWKFSKKLYLNTAQSGAQVRGNVVNFPVLVRLTQTNFNFSEAKTDGSDLRFTKSNGLPLSYEIERWDASQGYAEIWVKVDTVFGNDSTHSITMYWGAPTGSATVSLSNGASVFDTANGFQGVWHLGQTNGATAIDATVNHYDGTPFNSASISPVTGMVGAAQKFNGQSGYFQMIGTASGNLNFTRNGTYAISAWAYADTIDNQFRAIASKGDFQYNLEVIKEGYWQFAEFGDKTGWDQTTAPAASKTWVYLTGVRSGPKEYLYFNGNLADSTIGILPDTTNIRNTGLDFMIGRIRKSSSDTTSYSYKGMIDEVRIINIAPSADWTKLCYMNQRPDDKLIVFGGK